jgi:hypothetical protein
VVAVWDEHDVAGGDFCAHVDHPVGPGRVDPLVGPADSRLTLRGIGNLEVVDLLQRRLDI